MISKLSQVRKASLILNSYLLTVIMLYLTDVGVFMSFFAQFANYQFIWALLIGLFFVNVYCLSGILGILAESASDEKWVFCVADFHDNVRHFWPVCTAVYLSLFGIHFLLFSLLPAANYSLSFIYAHLNIVLFCLLALWIVRKKYLQPAQLPRRRIFVQKRDIAVTIGLFCLNLTLFYLPQFIDIAEFDMARLTILFSKYVELFSFIYFVTLILDQYPEVRAKFSSDKEVLLIQPLCPGIICGLSSMYLNRYPSEFVIIKALTPSNYRIREFHHKNWRKFFYRSNKLVFLTCDTSNSHEAYKIAKEYKRYGASVVMHGTHVSSLPEEALEFCDSVIVNELESVWQEIIQDYENKSLKPKYIGEFREDYHKKVHQGLLKLDLKDVKEFVELSRGCKFHCHFCVVPSFKGHHRQKPVSELVEILKKIKQKYDYVCFDDENIYNDPEYAKELFEAMKPLKVKWETRCTIDIAGNDEVLRLAKESGCTLLFFGYETTPDLLDDKRDDKLSMANKYKEYTRKVKDLGIKVRANFIYGYDSHDWGSIFKMWKFCFGLQPYYTVLSLYTPFPGTKLFHEMADANRLRSLNWRNYNKELMFKHKKMNDWLVSFLFPLVQIFFLLTTCRFGYYVVSALLMIAAFTVLGFKFLA